MPHRTLRLRGLTIDVAISDHLAARLRRRPTSQNARATAERRVVFRDPPPELDLRPRDPAKGLQFRDIAEDKGRQHATASGLSATSDLAERVLTTSWYHTIDLPGGITTPGQFDHRDLLPRYGLPEDMTGMRALDVATFNGYWAFEMERRGAEVIAIDLDDPRDWDYPRPIKRLVEEIPDMGAINEGFDIAHAALGSSVQRRKCSVYELDREEIGEFDLVHCGDLLLHLRDPLTALERMREVTRGRLLFADGIDADAPSGAYGPTIQYMGGWDDLLWWVPSLDALAQMAVDAGFRDVHVNCVYDLVKTYDSSGFWRASLTASV